MDFTQGGKNTMQQVFSWFLAGLGLAFGWYVGNLILTKLF